MRGSTFPFRPLPLPLPLLLPLPLPRPRPRPRPCSRSFPCVIWQSAPSTSSCSRPTYWLLQNPQPQSLKTQNTKLTARCEGNVVGAKCNASTRTCRFARGTRPCGNQLVGSGSRPRWSCFCKTQQCPFLLEHKILAKTHRLECCSSCGCEHNYVQGNDL